MTNHNECSHPKTKSERAKCRRQNTAAAKSTQQSVKNEIKTGSVIEARIAGEIVTGTIIGIDTEEGELVYDSDSFWCRADQITRVIKY